MRLLRLIARLAWPAAILAVALTAARIAARIDPGSGLWLWNLDVPRIDYPLAALAHEALRAGRLPLWDDHLGLGFPLYAEGRVGAFYPPNWLPFQLPPLDALDVSRVLHLALAGTGAGMLVLRLAGSRPGALIATLVAVLGGAVTASLDATSVAAAYAWLPWVLLPLVRRPAPTRRGLVAAGTLFGLQALAGDPSTWLLTGVAAAAILLARPPRLAAGVRVAGFLLLGTAVGAAQLIPTALLATLSVRGVAVAPGDLLASASTPLDPLGAAFGAAFSPLSGGAWNLAASWYPNGASAQPGAAAYVGLPVLALAAAGLWRRRSRPLLAAVVVLVAIPVIAALGPSFVASIPILGWLRPPVSAYLPATLLLGVIAGMAAARPVRGWALRRAALGVALSVGLYAAVLALALRLPDTFNAIVAGATTFGSAEEVTSRRQAAIDVLTASWPAGLELATGAAILVVVFVGGRRLARSPGRRFLGGLAAAGIVAIPLVIVGPVPNGTAPADQASYAGQPFLVAVAAAAPRRFLDLDPTGSYAGTPDQPAAAGIADLRMASSLDLRASDALVEIAAHDTPDAAVLRRALGVDVVATFGVPCPGRTVGTSPGEQAVICRDDEALRPPYLVPASAVGLVPVSAGVPLQPTDVTLDLPAVLAGAVPVTPEVRDPVSLALTVDGAADSWLWVDRAWWPGWLTFVDGRISEARRAIGGQLIEIPAGVHHVEMHLVPMDALIGLALGVATLAASLAWAAAGHRD